MMTSGQCLTSAPPATAFGPARVIGVEPDGTRVRVLLPGTGGEPGGHGVWARSALTPGSRLEREQTVLVAGSEDGGFYVIGILASAPGTSSRQVATAGGARAEVVGPPDEERLRVVSPRGELLFEYDARSAKTRVRVPRGDLELIAPEGSIDLVSAEGIHLVAKDRVEVRSLAGIELSSSAPDAHGISRLELGPDSLGLQAKRLDVQAERGKVAIAEADVASRQMEIRAARVKLAAERLESVAGQVVQKVQNLYQSVRGLAQLRAGRSRTIVEGTCQLSSQQALLNARGDFKIDGKQIYLG